MRMNTINKLCCPFDKADLDLTEIVKTIDGNILDGFLHCKECKRVYPIIKGVPIMSPDEYREFELEKPVLDRWQKHLDNKTFKNFRLEKKSLN